MAQATIPATSGSTPGTATPSTPPGAHNQDDDLSSAALVTALYEVVRNSRRSLDTAGLDPAAVVVLASARRLCPARPSDIACDIRLDLSTVSRHLRNLERDGYVDRTSDPDDGRAHRVAPTAQGEDVLQSVIAARSAVVDGALSHWTTDDRRTLTRLLRRLADDLTSASESRRTETTRKDFA
jgi:DNA-binding MarR family transcriptional regulator